MKKKILHILFLGLFIAVFVSCEDTPGTDPGGVNPKPVTISLKSAQLIGSSNEFSFDFFRTVFGTEGGTRNLMVSPLSVSLALAMTYNGAESETKLAMEEALRLEGMSTEEINKSFKELVDVLLDIDPRVVMEIANSIWYRNTVHVKSQFIQTNQSYYYAEVSPLDFNDPLSKNTINQWVSDRTHGKISQVIDQINPLDIMFLINAMYFKGTWTFQFDDTKTTGRTFTLANGTDIQVPTMYMQADVDYFGTDQAEGVILPYGQGNFRMAVIKPGEGMDLETLVAGLTEETWSQLLAARIQRNALEIYVPRFKYEYDIQLQEALSTLGMDIAFSPDEADFSGISEELQLYISSVLHKTFIEVNEQGTEAAAVTVVTLGTTSAGPDPWFKADRPFLYIIYEHVTGAILFMGTVNNPLLTE